MVDLIIGRYYLDRSRLSARKLTRVDERLIEFISFHWDTGRSDGNIYKSLRTDFIRWVDHEALSGELTDLQSRIMGS